MRLCYKPHAYQEYAIEFIKKNPIAAILLDMGMGKTAITLMAIQHLMYETFALEGLSKEQADQAMIETYGLNVADYVDALLKNYSVADMFDIYSSNEVYYVEGNKVFSALDWKAKFDDSEFTITQNGKLLINELTLEEGGPALIWSKA